MNITTEQTTQEQILKRFAALLKNNRLAHAYLFIGPEGVGKGETALAVAKLLNCEAPLDGLPCGACPPCRKIQSGNHPDVRTIESSRSESIKIEQIRAVIADVQLRPYEAERKVVIIRNTENLTPESGNALLKTLEEPPSGSLLILTTSVPEKNLDTVRSRCQPVAFLPSPREAIEARLMKENSLERPQARFLGYYAQGYLTKARRFHDDGLFARKNEVIDHIIYSADSQVYLKEVAADKDRTKELLDVLYIWFRDLLLLKLGAEERVMNLDRVRDLKAKTKQYSVEEIKDILDDVVRTMRLLNENLNVKIPLAIIKEKLWRKL
jgi:DNA polymerase-3 subunit delta'